MTYGNLIKNKIQHVFGVLFDTLPIERKLTDAQMECMQFGICDYAPKQVEEVPFFHYLFEFILNEEQLASPHPIRRSTKPISKIIILGIEMIFSF